MSEVTPNINEHWNQLREGKSEALSALYRIHYVGLMNYGFRLIQDRDKVNDSIISVLIDLWNKRSTLPEVKNVRAYLITSLYRRIILEIKSDRKREEQTEELLEIQEQNEMSCEDILLKNEENREFNQIFLKAFKKLTERQKELLRLKFFEDMDYDSIAIKCAITKRTAYNIIHDALKILKNELKGADFHQSPSSGELLMILLISVFLPLHG
ncbi:MAG TPA: sigma-70 family RNA polymerase sigma factor [Parasegetibacter sp.]